ncbi:hypothetical protein [Catellatospora sp. NPDC049609]|uniref:hypothetical protein n=1 Tax=Catellatospora sp. NPDC049609 TaxID=3155505 RepID=UPI0034297427
MTKEEGPAKAKPEKLVPIGQQSPVAPPAGMVGVMNTPKGKAVVDHRGFVLYAFNKDESARMARRSTRRA